MIRIHRFLSASLLLAALLTGCAVQPPVSDAPPAVSQPGDASQERYVFTRETFPRLDGSTSMMPLGQAAAAVLLGQTREEVSDLVQFNRTSEAYRRLMYGEADLLIAAEPAPAVVEEMQGQESFRWRMDPLAMDALVFVVNEGNPITDLTTQQIQGIYTGQYTNWSQVGGEDRPIAAIQRDAEAGSQTLMEKLVMEGLTLMQPEKEHLISSMLGLMETVRGFDGGPSAIGYSVYYYAHDMEMAQGLKLLSVDGVTPSADTIASGQYPFLNPYYIVTDETLAEGTPVAMLRAWLLGEEGQRLVAQEGYVALGTAG